MMCQKNPKSRGPLATSNRRKIEPVIPNSPCQTACLDTSTSLSSTRAIVVLLTHTVNLPIKLIRPGGSLGGAHGKSRRAGPAWRDTSSVGVGGPARLTFPLCINNGGDLPEAITEHTGASINIACSWGVHPRYQSGEAMTVRPCVQPGQLHEKAGVAEGYEAPDSDQSLDQADQDRRTAGRQCQKAGVSNC